MDDIKIKTQMVSLMPELLMHFIKYLYKSNDISPISNKIMFPNSQLKIYIRKTKVALLLVIGNTRMFFIQY